MALASISAACGATREVTGEQAVSPDLGVTAIQDAAAVEAAATPVGNTEVGVFRRELRHGGNNGTLARSSTVPIALQVIGYGNDTTFHYPAGLNLNLIAAPPQVK